MIPKPGRYYAELENILEFWSTKVYDAESDHFYGQLNNYNVPGEHAALGSVLYSRILWSFSAGFRITGNLKHLEMAGTSFKWLSLYFRDEIYGGVYWTISPEGKPENSKKQVYAQAFALYGFTEYYAATKNQLALDYAIELFNLIEKHSYDPYKKGYFEAFGREWDDQEELRLSGKDLNEKKTMNTHLHILEAYTNLYKIWPDPHLKNQLEELLTVFKHHIIDPDSGHLILFHNELWIPRSDTISYGHDIEASWLLREAAEVLEDYATIQEFDKISLSLVDAAMEGIDEDGGLNYEYEASDQTYTKEKHWWVQAEAAVGLIAAWQLSGKVAYLNNFNRVWDFIENHILDKQYGEWFWGVSEDQVPMIGEDKAGLWKCPYHNSRCCIEIIHRIQIACI